MRVPIVAGILLLLVMHVMATGRANTEWKRLENSYPIANIVSATALKLTLAEHRGTVSDFLFLRSIVHAGGRTLARMTPAEWKWFDQAMHVSTELDPYFADPYYFSNAFLHWHPSSIEEVNRLLEKGSRSRTWDSFIPFCLAFNNFLYLGDSIKASAWLRTAAERPGASVNYVILAARLEQEGNKNEKGIMFLEEMLKKEDDEALRRPLEARLASLQAVLLLEQAVIGYRKRYGKQPSDLNELVRKKIIRQIPADPRGGTFYLDPQGSVLSTVDMPPTASAP